MFITLLYVSAFLFFIADRKIKHSSLAGIAMIVLGVMAVGIIVLLISLIYMAKKKLIRHRLFSFIFSIVLIIISSEFIYKMIKEAIMFFSIRR